MITIPKKSQKAFIGFGEGDYFVVYPEGFSSALMSYENATNYARMFRGVVYKRITDHCAATAIPPWITRLENVLWGVLIALVALAFF